MVVQLAVGAKPGDPQAPVRVCDYRHQTPKLVRALFSFGGACPQDGARTNWAQRPSACCLCWAGAGRNRLRGSRVGACFDVAKFGCLGIERSLVLPMELRTPLDLPVFDGHGEEPRALQPRGLN